MPYVTPDYIIPGQVSSPTVDASLLDDVAALSIDALNLRPEALAEPHFSTLRDAAVASNELPLITWAGVHEVTTGSHVLGDVDPGVAIAPGGVTLELLPPNATRATLTKTGHVLRWAFSAMVEVVDFAGDNAQDGYFFEVQITGVDGGGTTTRGQQDSAELGILSAWSMNQAGFPNGDPNAGANRTIKHQRVAFSGVYIHQGEWTPSGGNVRISAIRVNGFVQNTLNSLTLVDPVLVAYIAKG